MMNNAITQAMKNRATATRFVLVQGTHQAIKTIFYFTFYVAHERALATAQCNPETKTSGKVAALT